MLCAQLWLGDAQSALPSPSLQVLRLCLLPFLPPRLRWTLGTCVFEGLTLDYIRYITLCSQLSLNIFLTL